MSTLAEQPAKLRQGTRKGSPHLTGGGSSAGGGLVELAAPAVVGVAESLLRFFPDVLAGELPLPVSEAQGFLDLPRCGGEALDLPAAGEEFVALAEDAPRAAGADAGG